MPAPIHIQLTYQEDQTLQALSEANGVSRRTKQRATAIRLNALGAFRKLLSISIGQNLPCGEVSAVAT
jgi:hypothetical protein